MPVTADQRRNAHGRFKVRCTEDIDIVIRPDNSVICDPLHLGTLLADLVDGMVFKCFKRLGLMQRFYGYARKHDEVWHGYSPANENEL